MEADSRVFTEAVRRFWATRESAGSRQLNAGRSDQGGRREVTSGRQLDGFTEVIIELLTANGVEPDDIKASGRGSMTIPGYFRPEKAWDLLVIHGGHLLAAIELKSQVGPSFGNNFNNRAEEAIGTAVDAWTAYREGAFGAAPQPWLGFLFLLSDESGSRDPVRVGESHFSVFDEFRGASYAERYEILCRRLVRERHFSSACFLTADKDSAGDAENYREPANDLSVDQFLSQLIGHLIGALGG